MRTWSLQYASNFFMDVAKGGVKNYIKPIAPNLALLGNTGQIESKSTRDFVRYCSQNWDSVFVVPGPWDLSSAKGVPFYKQTDRWYEFVRSLPNVTFLEQAEIPVPHSPYTILGAGLYRDTYFRNKEQMNTLFSQLYRVQDGPVQPLDIAEWHWMDRDWLKARLRDCIRKQQKAIILTNDLPNCLNKIITTQNGIHTWLYGGVALPYTKNGVFVGTDDRRRENGQTIECAF